MNFDKVSKRVTVRRRPINSVPGEEEKKRPSTAAPEVVGERQGDVVADNTVQAHGESREEVRLAFGIDVQEEAQLMERHFSKERDTVKELTGLRRQEDDVNEEQEKLLQDYEDLSVQFTEALKNLQRLQDQRNDLQSRLSELRVQSTTLNQKSKDTESRLESIRMSGNVCRKAFLSEVKKAVPEIKKANERYDKDVQRIRESEEAKRDKLQADFRLSELSLEAEKAKLLCQICMVKTRDTIVLPCTHFLYCNSCLFIHKRRSNTCPACRGSIAALLHCQLSIS
ncbi:hypothetical protein R1sor_012342 [Riccia sorocarpa]|uniref:RING-type domain-containing protein n=1 Tax=Riccia sorocarpa TaxID=122646 RepID=A0ABD3I4Q5_9MARC